MSLISYVKQPEELTYLFSQFNVRVGDIDYNKDQIIKTINHAQNNSIDLVIFPELALSGYPPRDFLHYSSFHKIIEDALEQIIDATNSTHVILGLPLYDAKNKLRNAAIIINETGIIYTYYKTLLPDYDVFDESRYFYPNDNPGIVEIFGFKLGLQICEDLWDHMWMHPIKVTQLQKDLGAELIINISASPYTFNKSKERLELVKRHIKQISIPIIYINTVGCQDDLVFDGRSLVVNKKGDLVYYTPQFEIGTYKFNGSTLLESSSNIEDTLSNYKVKNKYKDVFEAIKLNLLDYLDKSHLPRKLLVALSGGIDSALTLALCAKSVGSDNVKAVYLPTKFNLSKSFEDSKQLCDNLGVELLKIEIEDIRQLFDKKFNELEFLPKEWKIADENIQSRIRSNIMMYLSNSLGMILISTGNKSEIATGYCTLYGDTAGGKNLIGDLYKTEVVEFSSWFNQDEPTIPETIINRPPTAELRENQLDEDSLPPYDVLDKILQLFIDKYKSEDEIIEDGFERQTVARIIMLVLKNEFKRDQMVQTVKVSDKTFGSGRRFPIAANFFP